MPSITSILLQHFHRAGSNAAGRALSPTPTAPSTLPSLLVFSAIWGICFSSKLTPPARKTVGFWHTFGTGGCAAAIPIRRQKQESPAKRSGFSWHGCCTAVSRLEALSYVWKQNSALLALIRRHVFPSTPRNFASAGVRLQMRSRFSECFPKIRRGHLPAVQQIKNCSHRVCYSDSMNSSDVALRNICEM